MPTFRNQTIVVPFDFSAPSQNALNQVLEWTDESNTIHLVHVVVPTPMAVDLNPPVWLPPSVDNETRDFLLKRMKEQYGSDRFKNLVHHCVVGDPGTKIVELANSESADVIIMPSHGRSGLSRLFLGSVAERVLRMACCPVFVLRGKKYENDNAKVEAVGASADAN